MGLLSLLGLGTGRIKEALKRGAIIIDVRNPAEFDQGHIPEAINIPVNRISSQAARLREMNRPIVLCCNSGARSGIAKQYLLAKGLTDVYNGGGWDRVWRVAKGM